MNAAVFVTAMVYNIGKHHIYTDINIILPARHSYTARTRTLEIQSTSKVRS